MKIYDCFTFFDEIDLLGLRLEYLSDVVDKFVIVEGQYSHQGKKKKLLFKEIQNKFKIYLNKIIYIERGNYPEHKGNIHSNFVYDYHTRNGISEGLKECNDEDLILISDIDEFPKKALIDNPNNSIKIFNMVMIYFKFNLRVRNFDHENNDGHWSGTKLLNFKNFKSFKDVQSIRNIRPKKYPWWKFYKPKTIIMNDAGWHFRWVGTPSSLIFELKNRAIGRQEYKLNNLNEKIIKNIIEKKLPFGENEKYEIYPENKLPDVILRNKDKFQEFFEKQK